MLTIINNSAAPQGFNTKTGVVYVPPGATREVELDDVELENATRMPRVLVKRGDEILSVRSEAAHEEPKARGRRKQAD